MSQDPKEVAKGAADRICSYDNLTDDDEIEDYYKQTAKNLGVFLEELILIIAIRLNEAAQAEMRKGKIKEIDEALKRVREVQQW